MYILYHLYAWCLQRSEETVRSSETGVQMVTNHQMAATIGLHSLEEQPLLLICWAISSAHFRLKNSVGQYNASVRTFTDWDWQPEFNPQILPWTLKSCPLVSTYVPSMHSIIIGPVRLLNEALSMQEWPSELGSHKLHKVENSTDSFLTSSLVYHVMPHIYTQTINIEIKIFNGDLALGYCYGLLKTSLDCPHFSIMPGLSWFPLKCLLRALQPKKMIQNVQIGGFKKLIVEESVQSVLVATDVSMVLYWRDHNQANMTLLWMMFEVQTLTSDNI